MIFADDEQIIEDFFEITKDPSNDSIVFGKCLLCPTEKSPLKSRKSQTTRFTQHLSKQHPKQLEHFRGFPSIILTIF